MKNHLYELRKLGRKQLKLENSVINMIASDNAYPSFLSKNPPYKGHIIQEGLLDNRPFAGAQIHDEIERLAIRVACEVFKADHANLQPHSCSQANQAVYQALLQPGDPVLALDYRVGGHLTHGLSVNFSGKFYKFAFYGSNDEGFIDYDELDSLAKSINPKLIVCGSSSYPRLYKAQLLRQIADSVGAFLMLDLSHEAGLIAGGAIQNPVPFADVVTMSLDKTLRGPFGGLILCRGNLRGVIDKAVHPGTQSSFPIRKLTDATSALIISQTYWFKDYAENAIINAKCLANKFLEKNVPVVTSGTDKHYIVVDVNSPFGMSGAEAEKRLEKIGVLTNRQTLPNDKSKKINQSTGLRIGTAWATSRGYSKDEFIEIANIIINALQFNDDSNVNFSIQKVKKLTSTRRDNDVWNESQVFDPFQATN